jgi:hypothetical protein
MLETIGIPLLVLLMGVAILWMVIGSRGWWWAKAVLITLTVYASLVLWHNLETLQGFATSSPLPEKFEVHWVLAKEPNKITKDEGAILVWARSLTPNEDPDILVTKLHNKNSVDEPRSYKLPYTRLLHEQSQQIQGFIRKGGRFFGSMKPGEGQGFGQAGKNKGTGQGQPGGADGGSLTRGGDMMFYQLPAPKFPEKNL